MTGRGGESHPSAERMAETVKPADGADEGARLYLVAALTLIGLGVVLRLAGYFGGIELWWDEARWAMVIAGGEPTSIRPIGYVWLSRWLIDLRNTEPVIRSLSLVAGVVSLPVLLATCRQAGLSRLTSLFGLFVLAAHPAAIDMSKEFKPYALELLLHLLLLWLAFSYLRSRETWRLVGICLLAVVGPLFSWSIVVLYPGLFLVLAVHALRRRSLAQVSATVASAVLSAGMCLTAYWLQFHGRRPNHVYWGDKYDIFHLGSDFQGLAFWLLEKTYDLATFPARLETFWLPPSAVEVFAVLQLALCLLGVVAIGVARRWDQAALWVSPWLVTIGLNLLGLWPYGVFRTNLFLLAYSLLVGLAGLDGLRRWAATRPEAPRSLGKLVVPSFCSAFVLAFLPIDVGFFAEGKSTQAGNCHVHRAMTVAYEAERDEPAPTRRRRFLVDRHARQVYVYYRDYHAVASEKYRDFFRERYRRSKPSQPLEETIDRQAERGFWLLACHPREAAAIRPYALDRCSQVDYLEDFPDGGLLLRCRGAADRRPPPR